MWENTDFIKKLISESVNKTDVLNKLGLKNNGGNYNVLTKFIRVNKINIEYFQINKSNSKRRSHSKLKTVEILVVDSPYINTDSLKKRLYKEELKSKRCELCGQDENWQGKKMALILDHINGDRHDNRIENLRIVCPNCNATLETHCRGLNVKKQKSTKYDECKCGGRKQSKSELCYNCYKDKISNIRELEIERDRKNKLPFEEAMKKRRKVQRPSYQQILLEISELGFVGTGKKYNVSDNSIRKWVKMYEKHGHNF